MNDLLIVRIVDVKDKDPPPVSGTCLDYSETVVPRDLQLPCSPRKDVVLNGC